jgi:hypothetical protein
MAPTLVEAIDAAALELPAVERREAGGEVTWSAGGVAFAAAGTGTAEFRLDAVLARAALGTPDTSPSRRGAGWIAFAPQELDRFALDRATSWLAAAYRRAASRLA